MGLLCSKGFPKEYEDIIAGVRKKQPKTGENNAPVIEEVTAAEPPAPKPVVQQRKEDVLINNLLQRAKAGGEEERIAAAMAAAPEVDASDLRSEASEVSNNDERMQRLKKMLGNRGSSSSNIVPPAADDDDDETQAFDRREHLRKLQALLGTTGPASSSNAPPPVVEEAIDTAATYSASRPVITGPAEFDARRSPVNTGPSELDTLKAQGHSEEVVREAARLGLTLPSTASTAEEDKAYGAIDVHIGDMLGAPADRRPAAWERQPDSGRPSLEGPGSGRPSFTNRPSLGPSQRPSLEGGRPSLEGGRPSVTRYMGTVIGDWESRETNTAYPGRLQRDLSDISEVDATDVSGARAGRLSLQPSNAADAASTVSALAASRDSFGTLAGSPLQRTPGAESRSSFGNSKPTLRSVTEFAGAQRNSFGGLQPQRSTFGGAAETLPRESYTGGTLASERESFNVSKPSWQSSDLAKSTIRPRESLGGAPAHEQHGLVEPQRESFAGINSYPRKSFGEPASSPYANSDGTGMMLPPWRNIDEATLQPQQQQQQHEGHEVASTGRWGNERGQGAAQRNSFGGAAAMRDTFGMSAAATPPRESFGGVAARAPQQDEISMRVADGDRPAPKRRAKVAS